MFQPCDCEICEAARAYVEAEDDADIAAAEAEDDYANDPDLA